MVMGNLEPVVADASVVFHATEFGRELELHNIITESNAFQVMNVVKSTWRNWNKYRQY